MCDQDGVLRAELAAAEDRIAELREIVADQAVTLRMIQPHPFRPDQDDLSRCGRREDDPVHRVATINKASR